MLPNYPYTDFHRLNADWILEKTKEAAALVEGAESRFSALEADVAALQTNMLSAQQAIIANQQDIASLDTTLDSAVDDIATLQTGLGIVEQTLDTDNDWLQNHEGRLDTAEADITGLMEDVSALDAITAKCVRVDTSQSFTDAQKEQARANIGAAKAENDPVFSIVTAQTFSVEDSGDQIDIGVLSANKLIFTGPNDHAVTLCNLAAPTDDGEAATKGYVDSVAVREDLSDAFANQSAYATPQNFLAQQGAGKYVVHWEISGFSVGYCYADNDQPGGISGIIISRSVLVAYDGSTTYFVCYKSAHGSSDTTIYGQCGIDSSGFTFGKPVTVPTPTAAGHAATKGYVDALLPAYPTTNGNYYLAASVVNGVTTLSWESDAN